MSTDPALAGTTGSTEQGPKPACRDAARQLAICMQEKSPCVKEGGHIMDCLKAKDIGECEAQRRGYFECRRSQLDMRTRIRGKKFADYG